MPAPMAPPEVIAHVEAQNGTKCWLEKREPTTPPPNLQKLIDKEIGHRSAARFAWLFAEHRIWTDSRIGFRVHVDWTGEPVYFGEEPIEAPGILQCFEEWFTPNLPVMNPAEICWENWDTPKESRKTWRFPPHGLERSLDTITNTVTAFRYVPGEERTAQGFRLRYRIAELQVQTILKFARRKKAVGDYWFSQASGEPGSPVQVVDDSGVLGIICPSVRKGST